MKLHRFLLLCLGVGLLATSVGLGISGNRQRIDDDRDHRLSEQAGAQSELVSQYFDRARTLILLSAQNPAFEAFYEAPGSRSDKLTAGGPIIDQMHAALVYLEGLYPADVVSEVCFIHGSGAENARVVGSHLADVAQLSRNETANPFFAPTINLQPGQVYQAAPYLSPDAHRWVISNSTMLPFGSEPALLHFEVTLDSFRQTLQQVSSGEAFLVDAKTGAIMLDVQQPPTADGGLSVTAPRPYGPLANTAATSGVLTIDGQRIAFHRVAAFAGNENDWLVIASVPAGQAAWFDGVGPTPIMMLAAGLFVLIFSYLNFRASQRELRNAALTDRLTGLPNRVWLNDRLGQAVRLSQRTGLIGGVLMIDLDRFKVVNDTVGHHKGDLVLVEAARRLQLAVRASDSVARLGGDEFAVSLEGLSDRQDATRTAERIVADFTLPFLVEGRAFSVGASVGIAIYPESGPDLSVLLQHADAAMYEAKRTGSGYQMYEPKQDAEPPAPERSDVWAAPVGPRA
jgi:diguanylate cyclase (GGDEF)-like protein